MLVELTAQCEDDLIGDLERFWNDRDDRLRFVQRVLERAWEMFRDLLS